MTLREADEAAQKGLPIIHQAPGQPAAKYKRITQTGYTYDKNGHRRGFVQLLDKCGHSVVYADPACCELAKKEGNE